MQILKSAAHAFKQLGYHGATLEQIAAALKMQKGNLYYYFRSKEDILYACHQYSVDRLLDVLDTVDRADLHPEQKLHRLLVSFVHTILDDLHGTALFLDIKVLGPKYLRQAIARRDEFDRGLRRMVGWVLAENAGMLRLCARLGFTEHAVPGDPVTRRVVLDLRRQLSGR